MDEASSLLEKLQIPIGYRNISPHPLLVDGMVNTVPSPIIPVHQVVNLVSSSVEPLTKVVDPVSSSFNPTFHIKSETQLIDPISSLVSPTLHLKSDNVVNPTPPLRSAKMVSLVTSSVNPTPPLKSANVVNLVFPSVDPTPPLRSAKVVALVISSVNPTPPLKSAIVVDPVPPSIDPTLPLESKPDSSHIFLVDTKSTMSEGIPPSPVKTPPSNEAILFDWGVLNGPHLLSHIPFKIIVQVCGRDVPHAMIDEGLSISIFSSIWKALCYPQLVSVTQTLFTFNRRASHPLGILPKFPITLGGKTVFIDVMVVQDPLDFDLLLGRDYVYAMKVVVSTLFHVISFPHNGRIVTIDQLSFIGPD
jgi:hypothetical protein